MPDRVDDWRAFLTVAKHRSFARAAAELGRSPQHVTRAVARLEARLGVRLLHRTTRSVSLTSDGARFVERAHGVLDALDALESTADAQAPLSGRLSITAPVLFGQLHVVPIVAELLEAHPGLDVRLLLVDRVVSLADEGFDVAVRIGALPDSSLRARLVGHVRSVLVASPAYLKRAGAPRTVDALSEHACIAFAATTPVPDRWSFPGARRGVAVRPRLVVNDAPAALHAALAGVGIVRVLSYQVAQHVAERRLRVILEDAEPPPLPVHLVQLPGVQARAAPAFVELAAQRLRALLRGRAGAPEADAR